MLTCHARAAVTFRYVGEKDLAFFKYHAIEGGPCQGASDWQLLMQKDVPNFVRYQTWRRTLADGKTEYKSVTISPNATAREFSDLYLDDDFRRNWVSCAAAVSGVHVCVAVSVLQF